MPWSLRETIVGRAERRDAPSPYRWVGWAALAWTLTACSSSGHGIAPTETWLDVDGRHERVALPGALPLPKHDLDYALTLVYATPRDRPTQALGLDLGRLPATLRVAIDGEPATELEASSAEPDRIERSRTFRIPEAAARDGRVEARIEVEHRSALSGVWSESPALRPLVDSGTRWRTRALEAWVPFALFVGLVHLGASWSYVYFADRRRRAYLWFALQVLAAASYPAHLLGLTSSLGRFALPLMLAGVGAAAYASAWFTAEFLDRDRPPRWLAGGLAGSFVGALIAAVSPHHAAPWGTGATIASVALTAGWQFQTLRAMGASPSQRTSALLLAVCWATFSVAVVPDFASWLGYGAAFGGVRTGCLGLSVFAFLLSLLLSRRHGLAMLESDALNQELAVRVEELEFQRAEIESLNVELRRQIGDRSTQLAAALSLVQRNTPVAVELTKGELLVDRYRVGEELGRGGMGTVYEAARLADGKPVAIKVTRGLDALSMARLAREAKVATEVQHPNVVRVLDVDVAPEGFLFVVMELVAGPSLRDVPKGDPKWRLDVLLQIARGLDALHRCGIVHRDLKPANVLVDSHDGRARPRISDFGISRSGSGPSGQAGSKDRRPRRSELPSALRMPSLAPSPRSEAPSSGPFDPITQALASFRPPPSWSIRFADDGLHSGVRGKAEQPAPARPAYRPPADSNSDDVSTIHAPAIEDSRSRDSARSSRSGPLPDFTAAGALAGTPHYIAPELALGTDATTASDWFAFGVLAYELLTGRKPFDEPLAFAVRDGHPTPEPRALRRDWPECPAPIADVIEACLHVDPSERPGADEIARALEAADALLAAG